MKSACCGAETIGSELNAPRAMLIARRMAFDEVLEFMRYERMPVDNQYVQLVMWYLSQLRNDCIAKMGKT